MKKKLCITTYVSGEAYQEFIPVFLFSIYKSYPQYDVTIFCGEKIKSNVKTNLSLLQDLFDFKVIENYMSYVPTSLTPRVSSMSKRWLLYSDDFLNYEYVYIGDIDIFILQESPDLLAQHLIHCDTIGLDYSNVIRKSGSPRITGLHFVKRKPYYDKMLPVIHKYTELMENNLLNYEGSCEFMLYDMVNEAGLGLCPRALGKVVADPTNPSFRPEHGVHLAVFRDFILKKKKLNTENFANKMKNLVNVIDDPIFKKIESNFESKMLKRIFKRIHKYDSVS